MSRPAAVVLSLLLVGASLPQADAIAQAALGTSTAPVGQRREKPELTPVSFGYRMAVPSRHLGETRDVLIWLPKSYQAGEGPEPARYPVLYVLDGGSYFEPFAGMVRYLSTYELIPELIVVAVPHRDRMAELTFTTANAEYGDWPTSGHAESFQSFLEEELVPSIDAAFRTHPFRILVGHSLGGLFAVESLRRSPDSFQATIALSPSFAWNQFEWLRASGTLFDDVASWRHFLFISMEPRDEETARRLATFGALVKVQAPTGFEYELQTYPNESHTSVGFVGLLQSLRHLYANWTLEEEWWSLGPERVQTHFRKLSERFGYAVPIPEADLVGHALHGLVRHEAPDEAILLLELCVKLYPESADALEGLGEAYESKADSSRAKQYYVKALEVDPTHERARKRLAAIGG
jgi:predicted alpha/beta superfamily hydrolase